MKNVLVVGCGSMGKCLARSIPFKELVGKSRVKSTPYIDLFDINYSKSKALARECSHSFGATTTQKIKFRSVEKPRNQYDLILLALKPQDVRNFFSEKNSKFDPNTAIISVVAGVSIEVIRNVSGVTAPIVRSMPNICANVGESATTLCIDGSMSSKTDKNWLEKFSEILFGNMGDFYWIPERLFDAVTGLSGSGPAYLFMVIEALTDGGIKVGLPQELASKLAIQTVLGAAKLQKQSGTHPAVLRNQVTTPGGTTIHAVHELEDRGLRAMLISAVETATIQSKRLLKSKK